MECSENEQAGLGRSQGQRNGFQVAHFANEHDIGVLAQCRADCFRKRARISWHFALGDDALFVVMNELDRFFDRHDVSREVDIDVINQRCQRR